MVAFFVNIDCMTERVSNKRKGKNVSPENGDSFLVQTHIDEFLAEKEEKEENETLEIEIKEENPKQEENKENDIETEKQKEIENQKKKLDEAEASVSKQNSKKSKIINLVFFFVNIAIVAALLIYQLSKENFVSLNGVTLRPLPIFIAIALFALTVVSESFGVGYLLKQSTGKWRLGTAYKVTQIGRYYDSVTPMATGGQAFQVTYLKSRGVPIHTSLSIPLAKYVFAQMSWVLISLVCIIISFADKSYGTFVSILSIVGFILSFLILAVTLFLSVSKKIGKILVVKVLKLLYKMKIVKNYEKQYEKITKYIGDFQDVMKQYAKSPKDFTVMMFFSLMVNIFRYSIPYFVVAIFVPNIGADYYFRLMVMTVLVDLSSSFFPMPGGTGLNEISFTAAFGGVIDAFKNAGYLSETAGILIWVLLIWRFFSYYVYLVQGVSILSYDMVYGNRKYKWLVKKENLAEESMVFKQNQINKFRTERAKRRKNKIKNSGVKEYL